MTNKLTPEDIKKALECCKPENDEGCLNCPLSDIPVEECSDILHTETINLINRQQAEIERLKINFENLQKTSKYWKDKCDELVEELTTAKSEAIKEFAERLKSDINKTWYYELENDIHNARALKRVDELVKEMVGDDK